MSSQRSMFVVYTPTYSLLFITVSTFSFYCFVQNLITSIPTSMYLQWCLRWSLILQFLMLLKENTYSFIDVKSNHMKLNSNLPNQIGVDSHLKLNRK